MELSKQDNGIISPTSRPLIKNLILQHPFHTYQGVLNSFSKQEMELFIPFPISNRLTD